MGACNCKEILKTNWTVTEASDKPHGSIRVHFIKGINQVRKMSHRLKITPTWVTGDFSSGYKAAIRCCPVCHVVVQTRCSVLTNTHWSRALCQPMCWSNRWAENNKLQWHQRSFSFFFLSFFYLQPVSDTENEGLFFARSYGEIIKLVFSPWHCSDALSPSSSI